jgi:hypothetical protein
VCVCVCVCVSWVGNLRCCFVVMRDGDFVGFSFICRVDRRGQGEEEGEWFLLAKLGLRFNAAVWCVRDVNI